MWSPPPLLWSCWSVYKRGGGVAAAGGRGGGKVERGEGGVYLISSNFSKLHLH